MGRSSQTSEMKLLLLLFLFIVSVHARFRCTLGNWACTAGCVVLGQTSGLCDDDGKCWCSERSIALTDFRALLPSRCDLGQSVCAAASTCRMDCQAKGHGTGECVGWSCECRSNTV